MEHHRQLQDSRQAAEEAEAQLSEARQQLDAARMQLLGAEDACAAAQQRAKLAEEQATAMSGAAAQADMLVYADQLLKGFSTALRTPRSKRMPTGYRPLLLCCAVLCWQVPRHR
jgi:hypothetical protein